MANLTYDNFSDELAKNRPHDDLPNNFEVETVEARTKSIDFWKSKIFRICAVVSLVLVVVLVIIAIVCGTGHCSSSTQPNIVIIFVDDMGHNDIGYNNPRVHTPVLNKLAKEGRILRQYYVPHVCVPSRRGLLTGRYQWKTAGFPCTPINMPTLPEVLKGLGYKSHMFGKSNAKQFTVDRHVQERKNCYEANREPVFLWHLGYCQKNCLPTYRGFDTYSGHYSRMGDYYNHTITGRGTRWYDWHRGPEPDKSAIGQYTTEVVTNEAVKIVENHNPDDGPFFLYIAHPAVHVPLQVAQKYIDLYPHEPEWRRRIYLGMVSALDEQTGILIDTLDRLGLKDNTIFVFSTDNGGESIIGPSDNSPYRGGKATLFEGGSRVVGFISGKGVKHAGTVHDGLMASIDWFPTLVKLAKGNTDGMELDGIDQTEMLLHGGKSKRVDYVYSINMDSTNIGNNAIRDADNFKLIWGYEGISDGYGRQAHLNGDPGWVKVPHPNHLADEVKDIIDPYWVYRVPEARQLVNERMASAKIYPNNTNSGRTHLYDLTADPEERNNLAMMSMYAMKVLEMKQTILRMAKEVKHAPEFPEYGDRDAAMIDGTLATGYCDDFDIRV